MFFATLIQACLLGQAIGCSITAYPIHDNYMAVQVCPPEKYRIHTFFEYTEPMKFHGYTDKFPIEPLTIEFYAGCDVDV